MKVIQPYLGHLLSAAVGLVVGGLIVATWCGCWDQPAVM